MAKKTIQKKRKETRGRKALPTAQKRVKLNVMLTGDELTILHALADADDKTPGVLLREVVGRYLSRNAGKI